jgi:Arc/MetJ-type ribon-helix-helix transcriptional regulator
MTKETVRFPDGLVDRIRGAVDDSDLFESRSEFHRVSSELLLDLLDPEHEPTNFSYRELRTEIEAELGVDLAGAPSVDDGREAFLAAYIDVRRRALGGDLAGARAVVDRRYGPTDPEALLLDEVIGQYRESGRVVSDRATGADQDEGDRTADEDRESPETTGETGPPPASADGGEPETEDALEEPRHPGE